MTEGMLQVQLLIPSISADASITANMKRDEELELELKSEIKVMDVTSEQKIILEYGKVLSQKIIQQSIWQLLKVRQVDINLGHTPNIFFYWCKTETVKTSQMH